MRTTIYLFFISILFSTTSWAAETFDMSVPDQQGPSSGGFVDSFQKEPGASAYSQSPSQSPVQVQEEPRSVYENAFSSYHSKKSSEDEAADQADAWRAGQDKPDNFDVENLTYTAPAAPSKKAAAKGSSRVKESQKRTSNRGADSASVDEVFMPVPGEKASEIDRAVAAAPEADVGPAPVSAKERKAMIMQTISENYGDLKSCYNDGLRKRADMRGKVVMGWSMDAHGRVSGAEVETSQLNNKPVEKCMVERLSNWHFPRQAKSASSQDRMTYTFQFIPEKD